MQQPPTHHRAIALVVTLALSLGLGRLVRHRPSGAAHESTPATPEGPIHPRPVGPTPVDPNTATVAEWVALPGVGPALARRIVDDRARRGPYRDAADLERVPGIGPRTVARLRPLLRLDPPAAEAPGPR